MLTTAENELLCRVEGDAPMGRLMRRHWIPAALSEQLREPDGTPVRLRLLGEDLVAFRDTRGRLGVLGESCPHRKASLALGRNEECGLRCLYHGWKFDVDGNVLETPSEPPRRLPQKVKHKAYPAREAGGFVWVYMGPADKVPEFEAPPWAPTPEAKVSIVRMDVYCNWAQIMEGQINSAHSSTLHSSDMKPAPVDTATAGETWLRPSTDRSPRIQVELTNYGMRYAAIRRPIKNPDTHDYVRVTTYVAPFIALIPPNSSFNVAVAVVPRDDTSSYFNFMAWSENGAGGIDQEAWRKFSVAQVGIDLDEHYRPIRSRANNYLQDRQAMKHRQLHRHPRHSEPGHRDVGVDGAHRRSHERTAGRERYRHRPVPAADDCGGAQPRRGRRADRAHRAARAAGKAALVPGDRAEERQLAHLRRLPGRVGAPRGDRGGRYGARHGRRRRLNANAAPQARSREHAGIPGATETPGQQETRPPLARCAVCCTRDVPARFASFCR